METIDPRYIHCQKFSLTEALLRQFEEIKEIIVSTIVFSNVRRKRKEKEKENTFLIVIFSFSLYMYMNISVILHFCYH